MNFFLSESDFEFMKKNMPYAFAFVRNTKSKNGKLYFDVDDVSEFQSEMTDTIVVKGMDDEDTVNSKGKIMYRIYDEILYQKRKYTSNNDLQKSI